MRLSLFFLFLSLSVQGWSNASLKKIEARYRVAKSIQMDVEKTVCVKLLDRIILSKGKIFIGSGGRFRWDTLQPDKNMVLIAGNQIWMVDYPQEEAESVRVLKARNLKKTKPHALIAFLLGQGRLSDNYHVAEGEDKDGRLKLDLKPKKADDQVKTVTITLSKDSKEIDSISFVDNLDSTTELVFTNIVFNKPLKEAVFKFSPPKGAVVTDID